MTIRNLTSPLTPPSLSRSLAISPELGLPRYWATVHAIQRCASLADKTARRKLNAIDALYRCATDLHGGDYLDQFLTELRTDEIEIILEAFFNAERNRAAREGSDLSKRWADAKAFIFETMSGLVQTEGDSGLVLKLKGQLARWETRFRNFSPNPRRGKRHTLRALPAVVIEEFYEIFDPKGARNPFRSEWQRWRNFCILLCLLHQGLRRGEALLLPVDAIKSGIDERNLGTRFWMNVLNEFADEDPRYCDPPSIKNSQSIRQIPVSREVAEFFEFFSSNHRGRSPYPQLFLNSRGTPLGSRGMGKMISRASQSLSDTARKALLDNMREPTVSAHDFRHTCAVMRLAHFRAAGVDESDALAKLRSFFGWTYTSEMPRLYARAYWERHMDDVWNDHFDAHVDALRALEPGGWKE